MYEIATIAFAVVVVVIVLLAGTKGICQLNRKKASHWATTIRLSPYVQRVLPKVELIGIELTTSSMPCPASPRPNAVNDAKSKVYNWQALQSLARF